MKETLLAILSLFIILLSCKEQIKKDVLPSEKFVDTKLEVPSISIEKSKLKYNAKTSLWTLNEKIFSGYAVSYYDAGVMQEKIEILDGKKQNESKVWFPDGHLKNVSNYYNGRLHGDKKSWSSDTSHVLIAHLNYVSGKVHGVQKKWYPSGEIFQILNLEMGKEKGLQQAFRKNGDLYANYEAKAGRIFGLKKAALCFGLEDESVQYEN